MIYKKILERKRLEETRKKITEMRKSMEKRKSDLNSAISKIDKKKEENNDKFLKYIEIQKIVISLYKYYMKESIHMVICPENISIGKNFEFNEISDPDQIDDFVIVSYDNQGKNIVCMNSDFDVLLPEDAGKYASRFKGITKKGGIKSIEEVEDYKEDEYDAKILAFFDNEKKAILNMKNTKNTKEDIDCENYSKITQSISEISFFLLSLSHITNLPLLYGISVDTGGYIIKGNEILNPLFLYCSMRVKEDSSKKSVSLYLPEDSKKNFEEGVCMLNKNLIHLAYILGCQVPLYQDKNILPLELFTKYAEKISGEPKPEDKIDNSREEGIYKTIKTFLLANMRNEIKDIKEDYFSVYNFTHEFGKDDK